MVTRSYILAILVSLTLFACGSRKKQIRQEHQRTEQTAMERSVESNAMRGEKSKGTLDLVDAEGVTATTLYGADGTIGPDGSFTGKADSAKTVATKREQKSTQTTEAEQQESVGVLETEELKQTVTDEAKKEQDVQVTRSVPWYVWAGITVLVVFALWFGVWKRGVLNWIFKLFK